MSSLGLDGLVTRTFVLCFGAGGEVPPPLPSVHSSDLYLDESGWWGGASSSPLRCCKFVVVFSFDWIDFTLCVVRLSRVAAMEKKKCNTYILLSDFILIILRNAVIDYYMYHLIQLST